MTMLTIEDDYTYSRIFDPDLPAASRPAAPSRPAARKADADARGGDSVPPGGYLFTPRVVLAVNVALATGRPLLVRGEPGSGKSTLAPAVAVQAGWDLYGKTVTSRTAAQDLLWSFDALRRLHDAQAGLAVTDLARYVRPGVLWEALDPAGAGALLSGTSPGAAELLEATAVEAPVASDRAVILLDEVDKAEPDVPNDLLEPLGTFTFTVADLDDRVVGNTRPHAPLVVITTNGERDLPPAFLRRCVVLTLPFPDATRLVEIAVRHFGPDCRDLCLDVAARIADARLDAESRRVQAPGTAEYLDAIRACLELGIDVEDTSAVWRETRLATLAKWEEP